MIIPESKKPKQRRFWGYRFRKPMEDDNCFLPFHALFFLFPFPQRFQLGLMYPNVTISSKISNR
ncbi:MAG: hypothetical protein UW22_C0027G0005 [Candidatus Gottesmanbacteria bacterium GW2011_GWB1_44_11c]|uniref:Uncharacterized protein n=1 Tax=Candidatus Gottesmanbacteria bacterium GW2011_GWB1_44_11c TaxID=1618447 RepID=A0A0G1IZU6_9BACT|nr:MAG: hypothetical protein UW22_C0027G0005 [Candidatus Gottesmanbacteria bacterium GW2011_GWB1_44_11c]